VIDRISILGVAVIVLGLLGAARCLAQESESEDAFIDHGIAAPVSESRGTIATLDRDGTPIMLAVAYDIYKGLGRASLLVIDARTGATEQYWYPKEDAPNAANYCLMVSSADRFYLMTGDVFLEFDIAQRQWSFAKDMQLGTAMGFTEGPDGTIYAATYPDCHLIAFNPKTRDIAHLGQLDPAEHYPMTLATDAAGWFYAGIGTARGNLVAFNLETKQCRPLVDEAARQTGTGHVHKGEDGHVYGQAPGGPWLRLLEGKTAPVEKASPKADVKNILWGAVSRGFPDGSTIAALDMPGKSFDIVDAQGVRSTHTFEYKSAGAGITSLIAGPGNTVYGSTCHPFRFFACDAATGALENLGGLRRVGGGNFCGLAVLGSTVYGAAYCGGWLYAFDTTKPWKDSDDEDANPRMVVQYNPEITRPRTALAHPDGKHVLFAGFPGYGHVGGGVGIYNAETGESSLLKNEDILPGHSTITLKALPDGNLIGGTSINAPGGGHTVAKTARLYVMDWATRKVVFDIEPVPDATEINCIEVGPAGKVYGITNTAQFFVFDPESRQIAHRGDLHGHNGPLRPDQSLILASDGRMYALLNQALLEISTSNYEARQLVSLPAPATAGFGLCAGRVYYAVGSRVWSYRIGEE